MGRSIISRKPVPTRITKTVPRRPSEATTSRTRLNRCASVTSSSLIVLIVRQLYRFRESEILSWEYCAAWPPTVIRRGPSPDAIGEAITACLEHPHCGVTRSLVSSEPSGRPASFREVPYCASGQEGGPR